MSLSIPSMTTGNPLPAKLIRTSKWRSFFFMPSVRLLVYSQGMPGAPFKWGLREDWYYPSDITGY